MRGHSRFVGGLVLIAAAAAATGCSDDPRPDNSGTAGKGGGGGAAGGNGGGGVAGGGAGSGGTGVAGDGGGGAGGASGTTGTAGAGGTAGAAGTGGAIGSGGGGGTTGTAGTSGTTGSAGAGGATGTAGSGGATGSAGTGGTTGGAGGGGVSGGAGSLAAPAVSGGAVINSDFFSTSLSLINTQAGLVRADCVHTTIIGTGSKTISGDVVLPSQPQRGGQVVLVDRGNTALTFVNPGNCTVDRQFSVKGGFQMANPHDVVIVGDRKAYVTRYGKNPAPANAMAAGDDLLILDARDGTVTGRVDLSAYASADYPASPNRAVIAAGKVVVTLNRWSASTYAYGAASVVVVDPNTDQVVQNIALAGLKNCEGLDYSDATKTVLVACGGSFGSTEQALESGIAVIDVSATPARLARVISAVAFPTPPVTFLWALMLPSASSATRAFTATLGSFSPSAPDHLYTFDFVTGTTMSFGTATPFDLGRPAGGNGRLLVPDANMATPRIHVFDIRGAGAPTEESAFVADTVNGLPPREVAWY